MQVALFAHGVSPHVTTAMTRTRSVRKTSVVHNGKQLLCVSNIHSTIEINKFTVDILKICKLTIKVINGTERYFKFTMVYRSLFFLPFKVPLRPTNLPLISSMVLNGTERY